MENEFITFKKNSRNRKNRLCLSEIITILINFHLSGFKNFKKYYFYLIKYHLNDFPNLVSYQRFLEIQEQAYLPLMILFQIISAECDGKSYIDSTALSICHVKREYSYKMFKGLAQKNKSTMGWFIGFKLHMIVNQFGHPISFDLTRAKCDDRKVSDSIFNKIFGKLFGDRGYIGKPFFERMQNKMIHIITAIRSNMKPKILNSEDNEDLKKRGIIETTFHILKNHLNMQHTRHRSLKNFAINIITSICAFCFRFIKGFLKNNLNLIENA